MQNELIRISPEMISDNVFSLIGTDWMLITAGSLNNYNMMTGSWGGLGILWGKKVCFCVVRPSRYTYEFMEKEANFTLSFFPPHNKEILSLCGAQSGRTIDKKNISGLTPLSSNSGSVYFKEARLVLECKKIYFQDLVPEQFLDASIEKNYNGTDYHRMYIGEIIECLSIGQ